LCLGHQHLGIEKHLSGYFRCLPFSWCPLSKSGSVQPGFSRRTASTSGSITDIFLHLRHHIAAFDGYYFGARLAWIFPGYIAHSLFHPLVANVVLRLYVYWMAVLSAFFLIRRSYGIRCALVSSLLLCSYADFLSAAGWDYVDGAGIAYSLLCVEELGAAAIAFRDRHSTMWRAAFAGVAFAAAVHSNLVLVAFLPVFACLCLSRTGLKGLMMVILGAVGFAFLTACLGLVNLGLGGRFLFFIPSISAATNLLSNNPYYVAGLRWVFTAWWLVVPLAMCLVSIAFLLRQVAIRRSNVTLAGQAGTDGVVRMVDASSLLFSFGVFVILALFRFHALEVPFYASYLTIFLSIATGAMIGRRFESWRTSTFVALVGACSLLALLVGAEVPARLPSALAAGYISLRAIPTSPLSCSPQR